jgi:ERCC4-type nuclease
MSKLILVDHRWGQATQVRDAFVEDLQNRGYQAMVRQLTTGDLIWSSVVGRVGVELKSPLDLLRSHMEGRLDQELYRLQREFALSVLLITEPLGFEADVPAIGGFTWNAVDNLLAGRQMRGILVTRRGEAPLADRVDSLVKYLDRSQQRLVRPRQRHFPAMEKLSDRAEVVYALLSAVKGIRHKAEISETLAAKLALHDIIQLSETGWREAGFTKLMAGRLREFCTGT